jgi:hypothetical protein
MPLILLYTDDVPDAFKVLLYGLLDYGMDLCPPDVRSSLLLLACHTILAWFTLFKTRYPSPYPSAKKDL